MPALQETEQNLSFKTLLVLDNIISHKPDDKLMSHVKAIYATQEDLVNPSDGLIPAFQACYLRNTFSKLIQETKGEEEISSKEF